MSYIKILFNFTIISIFAISCKEQKAVKHQARRLVPYAKIYPNKPPVDTVMSNGAFVYNLVNTDTSDQTLYIKYGNKNFDSVFQVENGVYQSPCHNYEVCYVTENTLALIYQCMNSRALTILPLNNSRTIIHLNPLYIGLKQGFSISLLDGDGDEANGDSLLIANFDFSKTQYIKINALICGDRIQCFDSVGIKDDNLYLSYTGAVPNADPKIIKQVSLIRVN